MKGQIIKIISDLHIVNYKNEIMTVNVEENLEKIKLLL